MTKKFVIVMVPHCIINTYFQKAKILSNSVSMIRALNHRTSMDEFL
jgi:hypothetical protein